MVTAEVYVCILFLFFLANGVFKLSQKYSVLVLSYKILYKRVLLLLFILLKLLITYVLVCE